MWYGSQASLVGWRCVFLLFLTAVYVCHCECSFANVEACCQGSSGVVWHLWDHHLQPPLGVPALRVLHLSCLLQAGPLLPQWLVTHGCFRLSPLFVSLVVFAYEVYFLSFAFLIDTHAHCFLSPGSEAVSSWQTPWPLCSINDQPHSTFSLVLTQIIPGNGEHDSAAFLAGVKYMYMYVVEHQINSIGVLTVVQVHIYYTHVCASSKYTICWHVVSTLSYLFLFLSILSPIPSLCSPVVVTLVCQLCSVGGHVVPDAADLSGAPHIHDATLHPHPLADRAEPPAASHGCPWPEQKEEALRWPQG